MSNPWDAIQRRKFLKQVLGGLSTFSAGMALAPAWLRNLPNWISQPAMAADGKPRRHLINIIGFSPGGWEAAWFHNAIPMDPFRSYVPKSGEKAFFITTNLVRPEAAPEGAPRLTQRSLDSDYLELTAKGYKGRSHFVGSPFKKIFVNNGMSDVLIWKGIEQAGQHDLGNDVLNQGMSSVYAKSYSSVVAGWIASQDYTRPLHYVSNSETPTALHSNFVMAKGFESPICIADLATFQRVTALPTQLVSAEENRLMGTIQKLSNESLQSALKLNTSKEALSEYYLSLQNSNATGRSHWADSIEFKAVQVRYLYTMLKALAEVVKPINDTLKMWNYVGESNNWSANVLTALDKIKITNDRLNAAGLSRFRLRQVKDASELASLEASIKNVLISESASIGSAMQFPAGSLIPTLVGPQIGGIAFNFALADFLVRSDISAVVDIPHFMSDAQSHHNWFTPFTQNVAAFGAYHELITSLKEVPLTSGSSLLDQTLIVMHTEVDRTLAHNIGEPGTDHGESASVLLAGHRVNGGRVVGDISWGPLEDTNFKGVSLGAPLPINLDTGIPAPDGTPVSTKSLFPTVLSIFGAPVPTQQITEAKSIPAIIKG